MTGEEISRGRGTSNVGIATQQHVALRENRRATQEAFNKSKKWMEITTYRTMTLVTTHRTVSLDLVSIMGLMTVS